MAIDSRRKRESVLNPVLPWRNGPTPDGSLAISTDRAHLAYLYAGLTPMVGITALTNTRASILNYLFPWRVYPAPDGVTAITTADRLHVALLYRGIVPGVSTPPTVPPPTTGLVQPGGSGIVTFTSSTTGRAIVNPPIVDQEGGYWLPSIDNDGIITLTDNAQVAEGQFFAAISDETGQLWLWQVDPCDQGEFTTLVITSSTPHRVSIKCSFSTSTDTDTPFRIYSIRPYLKAMNAEVPFRHEAGVEARVARPSIRITHTGGPFVIDAIQLRLKPLKNQVKG